MKKMEHEPGPWTHSTGQGWTRLLASVLLQEEFSWLRRHMEQGRAHYISSQQPKVSDSRATNQEHWSVTLSGNWTLTRPCLGSQSEAWPRYCLCWHVITMGRAAITVIRWRDTKPSQHQVKECKSFKMSHCSGRFEFRLYMTPKDSWFNNLSCHFNLHPHIILGTRQTIILGIKLNVYISRTELNSFIYFIQLGFIHPCQ